MEKILVYKKKKVHEVAVSLYYVVVLNLCIIARYFRFTICIAIQDCGLNANFFYGTKRDAKHPPISISKRKRFSTSDLGYAGVL